MKNNFTPRKRNGLEVLKVPVPKGDDHIPPPHGMGLMPIHEFTMGLIAPKGKGKTTTIINMLEIYRGYFHRIIVFSPTIKSDSKWDYIKKVPLLVENMPLKRWIMDMSAKTEINGPVQPLPLSSAFGNMIDADKKFSPFIPEEDFIHDYDDSSFRKLMEDQKTMIDLLKDNGKLKTLGNRVLVIFDDQVGSPLFKRREYFNGINTRHRHHSASFIMVSQGYKEIPKTVRTNWTALLLYSIGNMKELEVIYEEFPMDLNWDDWYAMYKEATKERHDFLFLDMYAADDSYRMRKGFDQALSFA